MAVKWLRQNKAAYLDLEWNKIEEIILQPSFYSSAKLVIGDPAALRIKLRLTVATQDPFLQFMSKYMDDYADVWIVKRYLSGKESDVLLFIEKNSLAKVKTLKTEE